MKKEASSMKQNYTIKSNKHDTKGNKDALGPKTEIIKTTVSDGAGSSGHEGTKRKCFWTDCFTALHPLWLHQTLGAIQTSAGLSATGNAADQNERFEHRDAEAICRKSRVTAKVVLKHTDHQSLGKTPAGFPHAPWMQRVSHEYMEWNMTYYRGSTLI